MTQVTRASVSYIATQVWSSPLWPPTWLEACLSVYPGTIRPQLLVRLFKDRLGDRFGEVLRKYTRTTRGRRRATRSRRVTQMVEYVSYTKRWAYGFLNVERFANRHIFPNHSSGRRVPKENSALSKIREKRAQMKTAQNATNGNTTPTSRWHFGCITGVHTFRLMPSRIIWSINTVQQLTKSASDGHASGSCVCDKKGHIRWIMGNFSSMFDLMAQNLYGEPAGNTIVPVFWYNLETSCQYSNCDDTIPRGEFSWRLISLPCLITTCQAKSLQYYWLFWSAPSSLRSL